MKISCYWGLRITLCYRLAPLIQVKTVSFKLTKQIRVHELAEKENFKYQTKLKQNLSLETYKIRCKEIFLNWRDSILKMNWNQIDIIIFIIKLQRITQPPLTIQKYLIFGYYSGLNNRLNNGPIFDSTSSLIPKFRMIMTITSQVEPKY